MAKITIIFVWSSCEARYKELKAQGEAAGLPQNVEIWKRTGVAINAGNGRLSEIDRDSLICRAQKV